MAYSDDAVTAKLSSLNETQDSIVAVAQWVMFHRRHADRTAQIWVRRMQDSPTLKRLNLVYLANEVVQQSLARHKNEFQHAFEPVIADALGMAYKGASMEVQQKLKRVVEVWKHRNCFDPAIQASIEKRVEELDRARGGSNGIGGKGKLGGTLFSQAPELDGVSKAMKEAARAEAVITSSSSTANTEYDKMMDANAEIPSPPVYAARLNSLLKSLATATSAVEGCIKARADIVAGLEKLLETHKTKLAEEQKTSEDFKTKSQVVESKKRSVEDQIMQELSNAAAPAFDQDGAAPEPEAFTPPPPDVEEFTPPPEDTDVLLGDAISTERLLSGPTGAETTQEQPINRNSPAPAANLEAILGQIRQASSDVSRDSEDPRLKRRKMSHTTKHEDEEIFNAGSMGIDEDSVSALLGN